MVKKQIILNFISAWVSKLIKLFTALFLVPIFFTELGKEGYGVIILLGTILSFSVLADFGIRSGLVRYMTESRAKNDNQSFNEYVNTGLVIYICIWIALSTTLYFFSASLARQFKVSETLFPLTVLLLKTYGIITLFWSFTTPIFGAVISSYNRYDISNYRESILGSISTITIIVAVKYFNVGITGWATLTVFFQIITSLSIWIVAFKLAPHMKISFKYFRKDNLKSIFAFGGITFIGGWSRKMKIDADPLILSSFFGPSVISLYRSGVSIPSHTRPLISSLSGQIHTVSTTFYTQGDKKRFIRLFESGTKFTILLGTPMVIVLIAFGHSIMNLWLGRTLSPEDLHTAFLCMAGMAIVDFCFYIEGSSYAILYAMNKLRFMTFTDIFLGIGNILFSILLLKFSSLGVIAVLIPTIILEGIARPFYLYYTAGMIQYEKKNVTRRILIPCILVFMITLVTSLLLNFTDPYDNIFSLLIKVIITGSMWAIFSWTIALNTEEKKDILSLIQRRKEKNV